MQELKINVVPRLYSCVVAYRPLSRLFMLNFKEYCSKSDVVHNVISSLKINQFSIFLLTMAFYLLEKNMLIDFKALNAGGLTEYLQ